jgi:transposase InsO family protein
MSLGPGLDDLPDDTGEVLPSFAVYARFRRAAPSAEQADVAVREELSVARGLFDDTRVEPQEPDGRWAVDVRFVVTSTDGEHAVDGVHTTLRETGVVPDEVWVGQQLT